MGLRFRFDGGLGGPVQSAGMATYCVTFSDDEDWGEPSNRFKTRSEADRRLAEAQATGRFARLVRWVDNEPHELERVNTDAAGSGGSPP